MKIYDLVIANDHGGFELKVKILDFLSQSGYKIYSSNSAKHPFNPGQKNSKTILDLGCNSLERVDYPDYAKKVVEEIIEGDATYGILICNTGIGMSIAANRSSVIRAALCLNEFMAERARSHNNANVLVLASKLTDDKTVYQMIDKFLNTEFESGRHAQRINKIS